MGVPALGDIDGDARADIVVARQADSGALDMLAFSNDGELLWASATTAASTAVDTPIALADLDHDGTPEIISQGDVFGAGGELSWSLEAPASWSLYPVAADLDGDGYLEVIWGPRAYRHDGSPYYARDELDGLGVQSCAVANLDGDDKPEIIVHAHGSSAFFVLDHRGEILVTGASDNWAQRHTIAIHDLDGDGAPEILRTRLRKGSPRSSAI